MEKFTFKANGKDFTIEYEKGQEERLLEQAKKALEASYLYAGDYMEEYADLTIKYAELLQK